jgi:hypothetical protein
LDLGDFSPKAAAMETEWRHEVIDLSKDELGEFAERLIEDPDSLFMVNGHMPDLQLYRAEDLIKVFESAYGGKKYMTVKKMANAIDDSRLAHRKVRMASDEPQMSLYAVFDRDKWDDAKNTEWAKHYTHNARLYGGRSRH